MSKVIHTADPKMQQVLQVAENVATSRASVLIHGESGTGKELLAQYIHAKSNRSGRDFVALNCAAVPEGLLESELFGYERGAFTGADSRKLGKFELAHQSTFLLDEISELPLNLQSKILRVVQEGEIERVGGLKPIKIDVRIIAASNKNLFEMVQNNQFREDLFYRLNVIPLEIPPLRERIRDIELLSQFFMDLSCAQNGIQAKSLSDDCRVKLKKWKWPGNIRELQNVMERSVLLSKNSVLTAEDILIENYSENLDSNEICAGMTVEKAERLLIIKTLEHTAQNRTQAAHLLGISIRTLRNKLKEYKMGGDCERTF
ncbi:MAG: sigma-54-dependent Fis family transcriptional regulator [Bdellovibrionales bacterium]|nr:sigma-54-dependent Fis family transcriptional regulator [Bdellovibrionales bacterium]